MARPAAQNCGRTSRFTGGADAWAVSLRVASTGASDVFSLTLSLEEQPVSTRQPIKHGPARNREAIGHSPALDVLGTIAAVTLGHGGYFLRPLYLIR